MLKNKFLNIMFLSFLLILTGCSSNGGGDNSQTGSTSATLNGVVQKGPFYKDANITIYKIGEDFERTSQKIQANILDDLGHYNVSVPWSGLSEVVVSGYYYDEITGTKSTTPATLSSYVIAVQDANLSTNINVLSDLSSKRMKTLLKNGKTFSEAQQTVINEFENIFGITFNGSFDVSKLDLTQLNDANASLNAELLRISAALLRSNDPLGDLQKLMDIYNTQGMNGVLNSALFKNLQQRRREVNLPLIIQRMEDHNITKHVTTPPPVVWIEPEITLQEINTSLQVKKSSQFGTSFGDGNLSIEQQPTHGKVTPYFVGNEIWEIQLSSTDCYTGKESFIYRHNNAYGRVNITITAPQTAVAASKKYDLYNSSFLKDKTLLSPWKTNYKLNVTDNVAHGNLTLTEGTFSYDPDNNYTGSDSFDYTLSETVDECTYSSNAKVDFNVTTQPLIELADINITVSVKGSRQFSTTLADSNVTITQAPEHGKVLSFFVGNEILDLEYTSIDCFSGNDSFTYKSGNRYGRVNVTIVAPTLASAKNITANIKNTKTIDNQPLIDSGDYNLSITTQATHGTASIQKIASTTAYGFSYDPQNTYEGSDFFEYTLTQNISECIYSDIGRIDLSVTGLTPLVTTPTTVNVKTQLSASQPQDNAQFGYAVAIEGDISIVSEPNKQFEGSTQNQGAVYIYKKTSLGEELIQTLSVKDFDTNGKTIGNFGTKLSFKDGYLAIATGDLQQYLDLSVKHIMVYKKEDNATFTHIMTLQQNLGDGNEIYSLAINNNYLAVGEKDSEDLLRVYTNNNGSFTNPQDFRDTQSNTKFGYQTCLMGNLIIASSPYGYTDVNGSNTKTGAVVSYKDVNGTLQQVQSLTVPNELQIYYGLFGWSMGCDENYLAIGAQNVEIEGKSNAGKVYIYTKESDTLSEIASVSDQDAIGDGKFGRSVAISANYLAVGSDQSLSSSTGYKFTQIYQYSGDGNYTRLGRFDAKKYAPSLQSGYKEITDFGQNIAISGTRVISGARSAIAWNQLSVKAYKGGRAYILDCNSIAPSLVAYTKDVKQYEGQQAFKGIYTAPQTTSFGLSGDDAALFTIGSYAPNYYLNKTSSLSYNTPSDIDSNNNYEFDINITSAGVSLDYPVSLHIMKDAIIYTSQDNTQSSSNINNLWAYDSSQSRLSVTDYAKHVALTNSKALVSEKNGVFIFDKKSWNTTDKELLDLHPKKITLSDASTVSPTKSADFSIFGANEAQVAVSVLAQNNANDYNRSIHIYSLADQSLLQTIPFHKNSRDGLYPTKDYDIIGIRDLNLENNHLFVQYDYSFLHNDDNDSKDISHIESHVMIYENTSNGYANPQRIDLPSYTDDNASSIRFISTAGEYLAVAYAVDKTNPNNSVSYDVNIYKYSGNSYLLTQTIAFDSSKGPLSGMNMDEDFIVLRRHGYAYTSANEIYKRDAQEEYQHIDTLYATDAGATDGLYNSLGVAQISGDFLIMQFKKYLEYSDYYNPSSSSNTTIGTGSYLGLFKFDSQTQKFHFVKAFTKKNSGTDFGVDYEIKGTSIISNSYLNSNSSNLHMFQFAY